MDITIFPPLSINELGKRDEQEDSIFPDSSRVSERSKCFVLCDGMGGLNAGEIASAAACKSLGEFIEHSLANESVFTDQAFEDALACAYDKLDNASTLANDKEMGTTLAMLCFHAGGCLVAHIGDSRIYHFRPSTGEILYRSRDHSLVYQLFEEGEISLEEMKTSPKRNVILRAILPSPNPRTVADLVHITNINSDDYFLIGSDGMFENIGDPTILEILKSNDSDDAKCEELKRLSESSNDNHSAYIVHIKDVVKSDIDNSYPNDESEARSANKVLKEEESQEEVTIVSTSPEGGKDVSIKEDVAKENVNMNPIQLKHSGEKISLIIIFLTVIVITAAAIFFFISNNYRS